MESCKITVFTPTYNRAYIIENLYHSLQRQTFKNFEWVVVDDGSTDNTEALFKAIQSENKFFPVIYKKISNGGKHRAINIGVSLANGELFFIVDSDDYLTDNALERIIEISESIDEEDRIHFAGVCGKKGKNNQEVVGTSFEGKTLDISFLEQKKYNITGDQAEVFFTKILCEYPFPEFDNESFLTEAIVWERIANAGYLMRYFNDVIYICDYLPDGLSSEGSGLYLKNPHGYGLWLQQRAEYLNYNFIDRLKMYYSFTCDLKNLYNDKLIAESIGCSRATVSFCRIVGDLKRRLSGIDKNNRIQ